MTIAVKDASASKIFTAMQLTDVKLEDAPIPEAWILTGTPRARSGALAHSVDGWASSVVWECTAGSFLWQFGWEETVVILEGSVRVITETGEIKVLSQGDVAYFAQGTAAEWQIDSHLKKIAFIRNRVPAYVLKPLAGLRSIRASVRAITQVFKQSFAPVGMALKLLMAALGLGSLFLFNMVFEI